MTMVRERLNELNYECKYGDRFCEGCENGGGFRCLNVEQCSRIGLLFFFFSSRRRHTRLQGDWSSDVCSSDLDRSQASRERSHRDRRYGCRDFIKRFAADHETAPSRGVIQSPARPQACRRQLYESRRAHQGGYFMLFTGAKLVQFGIEIHAPLRVDVHAARGIAWPDESRKLIRMAP